MRHELTARLAIFFASDRLFSPLLEVDDVRNETSTGKTRLPTLPPSIAKKGWRKGKGGSSRHWVLFSSLESRVGTGKVHSSTQT